MDDKLKKKIEEETGFKCYETPAMVNPQYTFYGISANLSAFKALVSRKVPTATILYCLDTAESALYYAPTDTWY